MWGIFEEIMAKNFPLPKFDRKHQDAQQTPNKINLKRSIPRNIIIKLPKDKDKGS